MTSAQNQEELAMTQRLPLIALTVGDPAGIGPEIVRVAVQDKALARRVRLLVIGPRALAGYRSRSNTR